MQNELVAQGFPNCSHEQRFPVARLVGEQVVWESVEHFDAGWLILPGC